jgi:Protein of unknown function (DUF3626)
MHVEYFCIHDPSHPTISEEIADKSVPEAKVCETCGSKMLCVTMDDNNAEELVGSYNLATAGIERTKRHYAKFLQGFNMAMTPSIDFYEAKQMVQALTLTLQQSPLTINFKLTDFRNYQKSKILSGFQLPGQVGNVNTPEKQAERIAVENKLFGYSWPQTRMNPEKKYQGWNQDSVMCTASSKTVESSFFQKIVDSIELRPKYCALDYRDSGKGATPNGASYGFSFFHLKDELKRTRCTFTYGDSWDVVNEDVNEFPNLFSYDALDLLLMRAAALGPDKKLLQHLCRRSNKRYETEQAIVQGYEDSDTYIEAQLHGKVSLKTDVLQVNISRAEVMSLKTEEQQEVQLAIEAFQSDPNLRHLKWKFF